MMETCVFLNNNDGLLSPHYHYQCWLFGAAFLFFFKIQKALFLNIVPHSTEGTRPQFSIFLFSKM